MVEKIVSAECLNCESTFEIEYMVELVSEETPLFCPFCGEKIENVNEEFLDDIDTDGDENLEWD